MKAISDTLHRSILYLVLVIGISIGARSNAYSQTEAIFQSTLEDCRLIGLRQTPDGGSVLLGESDSGIFLIKIAVDNSELWRKNINADRPETINSMEVDSNGDIICSGLFRVNSSLSYLQPGLVRLNAEGVFKESRVFVFPEGVSNTHLLSLSNGTYCLYGHLGKGTAETYIIRLSDSFIVESVFQIPASTWGDYLQKEFALEGENNGLILLGTVDEYTISLSINSKNGIDSQRLYGFTGVLASEAVHHSNGDYFIGVQFQKPDFKGSFFYVPGVVRMTKDGEFELGIVRDNNERGAPLSLSEAPDGTIVFSYQHAGSDFGVVCMRLDTNFSLLQLTDLKAWYNIVIDVLMTTHGRHTGFLFDAAERKVNDQYVVDIFWGSVYDLFSTCVGTLTLAAPPTFTLSPIIGGPVVTTKPMTVALDSITLPINNGIVTPTTIFCTHDVRPAAPLPMMLVYPNPAPKHSLLHLDLPAIASGTYTLSIRSITGVVFYQRTEEIHTTTRTQLSLPEFAAGWYIVELQDANSFATVWRGKVVVE